MKKAKLGRRGSAAKKPGVKQETKSVSGYFAGLPKPARMVLQDMRMAIRAEMPARASEVISYGIPAFREKKVLVWFAAFANHCSLFPTAEVIQEFREELKEYSVSKGTVKFPLGEPLPIALIRKIVKLAWRKQEQRKAHEKHVTAAGCLWYYPAKHFNPLRESRQECDEP